MLHFVQNPSNIYVTSFVTDTASDVSSVEILDLLW